jgi:osmotically-inducible protein OsmY
MALAMNDGMRTTFTSSIALSIQLLAASTGVALIAPALTAQTPTEQSASVRKAFVADKTLSTAAHNVTITSQDGMVTLKGRVKSEAEKKAIEDRATEIAGAGKVTSELMVAP